jgi:hypothetical protein
MTGRSFDATWDALAEGRAVRGVGRDYQWVAECDQCWEMLDWVVTPIIGDRKRFSEISWDGVRVGGDAGSR